MIHTLFFRTRKKALPLLGLGLGALTTFTARPGVAQTTNVLKSHNDLANTGQNLQETVLTPPLLRSGRFGLLFKIPVDTEVGPDIPHNLSGSEIYAQPLYMAGLSLPNGERYWARLIGKTEAPAASAAGAFVFIAN
ncbi:hypothetical protein EON83_27870 [bacterium]|nr:MAG: hypothetical protein EON83_27870 [bacterium]